MSLFHTIEKQSLRRAALERRAALAPAARAAAAAAVVPEGLALAAGEPAPVALFASVRDEIDTGPLAAALAAAGAALALPAVTDPAGALAFRAWRPGEALAPGYKGIPEPPADAPAVEPGLVFVPLAAFDRRGHRLGYGEGHYDRTLAVLRNRPGTRAVGLAFSVQEVFRVPELAHDVRLDAVLTERGLIRCVDGA